MTEHVHPGPHLDPELLNAFVEGVLPEHERKQCLSHVAECSRCREIAFLAQAPLPEPVLSNAVPLWRRWLRPIPVLSSAVAACALLIAVALYRDQTPPTPPASATAAWTAAYSVRGAAPEATERQLQDAARVKAKMMASPPPPATQSAAVVPPSAPGDTLSYLGAGTRASGALPQARIAPAAPAPPLSQLAEKDQRQPLPAGQRPAGFGAKVFVQPSRIPLAESAAFTGSSGGSSLKLNVEHERNTINGLSEVKGSVTDATGSAVAGATVIIRHFAGPPGGATVTGPDGRFAMAALPAGRYEIEIESPGFQKAAAPLELQPQDIALVESKLSVGSTSETVEVTAANAMLSTESSAPLPIRQAYSLPSKLPVASSAISGNRVLVADSAGALFFSPNAGKQWETVKPQWQGKVKLVLVPAEPIVGRPTGSPGRSMAALPAVSAGKTLVFELVTDAGSTWFSQDGTHWYPQPPRP